MKTKTVGQVIKSLVKRFNYPMGIYMLEQALEQLVEAEVQYVEKGSFNKRIALADAPGYKRLQAEEQAILNRIQATIRKVDQVLN